MKSEYKIGTTLDNMVYLESIGLPVPYQLPYVLYSKETEQADGLVSGHGWPTTELRYGFLTYAQRNLLKGYISGKSSEIYVKVLNEENDWIVCKAIGIWVDGTPLGSDKVADVKIILRILEIIE